MNESLLVCQNVSKTYQEGQLTTPVLFGVDLTVNKGDLLAIIGSSGSGKSTLLHILGALDKPTKGDVLYQGKSIFALNAKQQAQWRNQRLGFIYQFELQ